MLPVTLADEVKSTLLDYLTTTFNFQDGAVEAAMLAFLTGDSSLGEDGIDAPSGMFRGPYVHLRLPFRKISEGEMPPLEIAPPFRPYLHQLRAFERLSSFRGSRPRPTLITTGTGSGKTECFLYPILDHCHEMQGAPGIKAIILYPMNALASDQAGRLAKTIHDDDRLRGQVRAGLYVGGRGEVTHDTMGPEWLIDDRAALRANPPAILLTNYKMLDFLLLRPEDKGLWSKNRPETLQYLVLDELHTYDGAQGSDVGCLIRRLKARLGTPEGFLCPVGTSATVASDSGDTQQELIHFAEEIFGQPFPEDAVIGEDRIGLAEFLPKPAARFDFPADLNRLEVQAGEDQAAYIGRQSRLWFDERLDPLAVGDALKQHNLLRVLLAVLRDQIVSFDELCLRLGRWDPEFGSQAPVVQRAILGSFLGLIAHARARPEREGDPERPLLTLQVQLWIREMSRLMRAVGPVPRFFWRDDVPLNASLRGLPPVFCRECGHSGWLAVMPDGDDALTDDPALIYRHYFDRHKSVIYIFPQNGTDTGTRLPGLDDRLCPGCLKISAKPTCANCGKATIPVMLHRALSQPRGVTQPRDLQRCPFCDTSGALSIVGSAAASLSSVAVSHLFTSPLNDDKKLLAFTDSVQDASHRAAFFGARTYRFSMRTAFQALLENGREDPIRLDQFTQRLIDHWLTAWNASPSPEAGLGAAQKLAATFVPPDLRELASYRRFIGGPAGPLPRDLDQELRQRLSWEVLMEYGFNARIGRSLERVGSSAAFLDPELLKPAVDKAAQISTEEIGTLRGVGAADMHHFVVGLLQRTRTRGGMTHPLLNHYIGEQGNWYLLSKKRNPLLSPFFKNSPRFPRFLTDRAERDVFDLFITRGSYETWYADWARRALEPALAISTINDLYRLLMPLLVHEGLLRVYPRGRANAYGLVPSAWMVTRQTEGVRCNACGDRQTVYVGDQAQWLDRPCLSFRCAGRYQADPGGAHAYYRALYGRGNVERIFAQEHTGLLARETRETIETQFKEQSRADAPNLLAATPTLELGIDIGDLSAAMAGSVPPSTANYLQRIGRAGRKTGNSLVLTLANVRPHDLYFFAEPLEMIAGAIVPPGCFLDAPNMLQRQFLAFSMDCWTASDPRATQLPRTVKDMLARVNRGGFPEDLLLFYDQHKKRLVETFLGLFGAVVSSENQQVLRDLAAGDRLPELVRGAVADVMAEREALRSARKTLRAKVDQIKADPSEYADPQQEIEEIEREMKLVLAMIQSLEDKYILNFFTDAGLLPNYAFPETGVRLRTIITGIEAKDSEDKSYAVHEYIRPAAQAISELAPFNTFYAEGRKVPVTHLSLQSKQQDEAVERWQFCSRCSMMARVATNPYQSRCPICNSDLWSDRGQQHDMLRMRQVSSWAEHHSSLTGDEADDRDRESYQLGRYFEIPREQDGQAHIIPSLPFGIEFMNEVTLREINFGLGETWGQRLLIADEERPETGYQVCTSCGAVRDPRIREDDPNQVLHARNCVSRSSRRPTTPKWHDLYLYREVTSEALRILLPVSTVLVEEKLVTFSACLSLGLSLKFRGNPGHLQILPHVEVSPDGTQRRFLVIYDAVPGGTSFLRDLAKPHEFQRVLQLALDRLTSCSCRLDPDKQACYRCLYSYRAQRDLELISRRLGVEMLQEILSRWGALEEIHSLSDAHMANLLESELEQRFVDALGTHANQGPNSSWSSRLHNGKLVWDLVLGVEKWLVEPQVLLGPAEGAAVPCKPDFILWPQGATRGKARPVAVFTDGFAYHARPGQPLGGLPDDLSKRQSLVNSGRFVVWAIAWDDVVEFPENNPCLLPILGDDQQQFVGEALRKSTSSLSSRLLATNAMDQLVAHLRFPATDRWSEMAVFSALAAMRPLRPAVADEVMSSLTAALRSELPSPDLSIPDGEPSGDTFYGITEIGANQLLVHAPVQALRTQAAERIVATLRLNDSAEARAGEHYRDDWRRFLLLVNLCQFLPGFRPVTSETISSGIEAVVQDVGYTAPHAQEVPDIWKEAFDYAAPECHEILKACLNAGLQPPVVGHELLDDNGRIVGAAELAWIDRQKGVFLSDQAADKELYARLGWQVFSPNDGDQLMTHLMR